MSITACINGEMTHAGLPVTWGLAVWAFMVGVGVWAFLKSAPDKTAPRRIDLTRVPGLGPLVRYVNSRPYVQFLARLIVVAIFVTVVVAGLYGTPIPERNAATVLTWNLWWTGVIISVFFVGTAWCGVCPWDTLATWLVRRRPWGRAEPNNSLNLRVPGWLRTVYPALLLLIGLTWLELGVGVTLSPYATAVLALVMVMLATVSLSVFERKAFCRYFCPVGRTIGAYAQLAPVELRPIDTDTCARCETLECYHGSATVEPCPTNLVMGRLKQNTYCTSCGNCTQSCPRANVAWNLRPTGAEAAEQARPHLDASWFILGLLALTGFHGLTMIPEWEKGISALGQWLGDSGQLLWAFSLGLAINLIVPIAFFSSMVGLAAVGSAGIVSFKQAFIRLAPVTLPLAFAYHLAHNLKHLVREGGGLAELMLNPLGTGALPLSDLERHLHHFDSLTPDPVLSALQAGLMAWGFWIAVKIIRHRGHALFGDNAAAARRGLMPMLVFALAMTGYHVWLLTQNMVMRM